MALPHDVSEPLSPLALQICNMLNAPADEYFTFQVTLPSARPHLSVLGRRGAALSSSPHPPIPIVCVKDKKQFWSIWKISKMLNCMVQAINAVGILQEMSFTRVKKVREDFMGEARLTLGLGAWPNKPMGGWRMNNVVCRVPSYLCSAAYCAGGTPWYSDARGHPNHPAAYSRCMHRDYETSLKNFCLWSLGHTLRNTPKYLCLHPPLHCCHFEVRVWDLFISVPSN